MQSIIHKPTLYLQEVQDHLYNATGKWVSASTTCRTIKARDFTREKVQVIALQQSEQRRIEFMVQIAASYNPDMFIWIDETGSDQWTKVAKSKVDLFRCRMPHFRILLQQLRRNSVLFKPKRQHGHFGPRELFTPCQQGSLPWTKVAKQLFPILIHKKLARTKVANLLFRISVNKKLAWTKAANQLFEFPPTCDIN